MLFARNERPEDFKLWSNPSGWDQIPPEGKKEFIWRTEGGVCSSVFKARIDAAQNVHTLPGMIREARMREKRVALTIQDHYGNHSVEIYKRLVVATGFRRWAFQTLFHDQSIFPIVDKARHELNWEIEKERQLAERIRYDLSYSCGKYVEPRLFLPTLAGPNCGPGFPTLGCLGIMSERIVRSCIG